MNILYVTNTLHRGGAEAHLLLLGTGLQARGAICEIAYLRSIVSGGSIDLRDTFESAGIKTHYLNCEKSYDPRSGLRLNRLLATRKWDILHSHLPRADAAAIMCKVIHPRQTWISTIHHPYDNAYAGARLMPAMAPMWKRADGVIAVSEPVRQWSIRRLGLSADRVRTIQHGIDIEPGVRARAGRLEGTAIEHRCCIGSIGRYEERKGHETLILAMVTVLKRFPNAQLKIAGHDPWGHGDVLRKMIVDLNLEQHVQLTGFITDKERFFSEIDVFAFASRSEGFGIVVLEAMHAGIPAIVSNISPLNEIICPGTSGLVADLENPRSFANAIMSLFENREYMRRIAVEGQRRVATEFSQERMVEKTLGYYHDVLDRRTAATA
jgi:glycosyltransferase involved in cell wall biosynthesis